MLVKSTPGVDFTNVLRAAFTRANPKSANIALLGSACIEDVWCWWNWPQENSFKIRDLNRIGIKRGDVKEEANPTSVPSVKQI